MTKPIRSTLGALALAVFLPLTAQAQTKPAATPAPATPAQAKPAAAPAAAPAAPAAPAAQAKPRALAPAIEARWDRLFKAAKVLAHEGMEMGRITVAEQKQIDDYIANAALVIAKAKQGGIGEAEEGQIDGAVAALYA